VGKVYHYHYYYYHYHYYYYYYYYYYHNYLVKCPVTHGAYLCSGYSRLSYISILYMVTSL